MASSSIALHEFILQITDQLDMHRYAISRLWALVEIANIIERTPRSIDRYGISEGWPMHIEIPYSRLYVCLCESVNAFANLCPENKFSHRENVAKAQLCKIYLITSAAINCHSVHLKPACDTTTALWCTHTHTHTHTHMQRVTWRFVT